MTSKYERIKSECKKKNIQWEDPDFQAVQTSVFYYQTPPFTFQWKRIPDIINSPLFMNEVEHFDVIPGKMGDRWLVSCLGVLYSLKNLFYRVVPADQNFKNSYGVFRFRLWWCGEWVEVLVDDRLPTINGKLAFLQPYKSNCFWAALLEKAIAKLHGAYEALKYGTRSYGLSDLTGGIVETIPVKSEQDSIRPVLLRLILETTSIITCIVIKGNGTQFKSQLEKLPNGINVGVSYRLCSLDKVETMMGDSVQLVRIKDPFASDTFGTKSGFMGEWSSMSAAWERVSIQERDRLLGQLDVGEFWMSFLALTETFTELECIHLDTDTAKDELSLADRPMRWCIKMLQGFWRRGVSAGGCRNYDSFHINPQLLLVVTENENVIIALNQHTAIEPKVIGFTMYQLNSIDNNNKLTESFTKEFFKSKVSFINSDYGNSRYVSYRYYLESGRYLLMPTTYEPGEESGFTIRILGNSVKLAQLETQTMMLLDPFPQISTTVVVNNLNTLRTNSNSITASNNEQLLMDGQTNMAMVTGMPTTAAATATATNQTTTSMAKIKKCQYEPVFMQLADENKTINCFELQELLEACLPNDYIKSCASLDVCRQVISLVDKSGNGRINFLQFKTFMVNLKVWQGVFKMYTKENAGILRAERLRDALYDVGFQLGSDIMAIIILKYMRKDGTLRMGDFASSILHLTTAFEIFQKKDHDQDNVIKIEMTDWIKSVLRC